MANRIIISNLDFVEFFPRDPSGAIWSRVCPLSVSGQMYRSPPAGRPGRSVTTNPIHEDELRSCYKYYFGQPSAEYGPSPAFQSTSAPSGAVQGDVGESSDSVEDGERTGLSRSLSLSSLAAPSEPVHDGERAPSSSRKRSRSDSEDICDGAGEEDFGNFGEVFEEVPADADLDFDIENWDSMFDLIN